MPTSRSVRAAVTAVQHADVVTQARPSSLGSPRCAGRHGDGRLPVLAQYAAAYDAALKSTAAAAVITGRSRDRS